MKAKKKPLDIVKPADLGVDVTPRLKTLKVSEPPKRGAGVKVADVGDAGRQAQERSEGDLTWPRSTHSSSPSTTTPALKPGDAEHRHRGRASSAATVHVLVAGARRAGAAQAAAADRRRRQGAARRRAALRARPGRERRRAGAGARRATTATSCSPATAVGKNVAPRVAAKLDVGADLRHHQGRVARHLRAADLRRQRDRDGAEPRRDQGDHGAHDRLRSGAGERRLRPRSRRSQPVADTGKSQLRRHARSPRTTGPS